ncbi:MAG TPA: lysine--tRNA ligase [Candidatus Nanoarchaeia archaeon]|nr:lysine--tRNA ligase [Candidatus Nanoarchaeia archaeon]
MEEKNTLMEERLRKREELQKKGIHPYPYSYPQTHHAKPLQEKYAALKIEEKTTDEVSVAGRLVLLRRMGKATFAHLQDQTGRVQLYFREDQLGKDPYDLLKLLDTGDLIGVKGTVFRTKTGEITVSAQELTILCKATRPLPEKFHGLKDEDMRHRYRELDLIANPDYKEVFIQRTKIIDAVHEFMKQQGFLEVQTPVLQTVYGGAEARPFKTHINAWNMDLYLQISPELYLKRLIVGGFEKVYTICKNFRNEGVDKTHNPEFMMMEFYQSYVDYHEMMRLTEDVFAHVAHKIYGKLKIPYQGKEIDFSTPWKRLSIKEALLQHAQIDVDKKSDEELQHLLDQHKIEYRTFARDQAVILLFEALVEEKLIQPIFIIDYPKIASPLCKEKRGHPELIEKVEPYVNGWEMGNGYSELNDPVLQRKLLEEQAAQLRAGVEKAQPMDEDFARAIETGMTPTGGMGIGIDRMVILFTNQPSLRETLLFPTMKPLKDEASQSETKP